jgi:hypothetical protein
MLLPITNKTACLCISLAIHLSPYSIGHMTSSFGFQKGKCAHLKFHICHM